MKYRLILLFFWPFSAYNMDGVMHKHFLRNPHKGSVHHVSPVEEHWVVSSAYVVDKFLHRPEGNIPLLTTACFSIFHYPFRIAVYIKEVYINMCSG